MGFCKHINLLACALAASVHVAGFARADTLTVFAAASLKEVIDDIGADFEERTGHTVITSYAGSSALARQIEYGAPADVFISASTEWMDYLEAQGALAESTRVDLVGNRLVLIGPADDSPPVRLDGALDLPALLKGGRLAVALTNAVPAGIYAKLALESLGLWPEVQPFLAETDNVRAAMALVAVGAAPLGIVYATDARAEKRVSIRGYFPQDTHPEIVYPAALTARSTAPAAPLFLDYLKTPAADEAFESYGFILKDR
jgi:molybdate transport system substrate-binding protein